MARHTRPPLAALRHDAIAALRRRTALELRFDGPIPPRLLAPKSERELMIDHHRAMIRYSDVRIQDFESALAELRAGPESPAIDAWIGRILGILADHRREKDRHQRDLDVLIGL